MTIRAAVFSLATITASCLMMTGTSAEPAVVERPGSEVLERFFQSGQPPLVSYRARRHLGASSMGGRMSASLDAWTYLNPDGTFGFEIIRESGSGLIREHVLLAALHAEQRVRNQRETSAGELTRANYDFRVAPNDEHGKLTLELIPKRKSPLLINGTALITAADADLVRIQGSLADPPSYWTRHVDVVRRYERIGGVRVAVEMRSRADVRVAGESSFSMSYQYTTINGRTVERYER